MAGTTFAVAGAGFSGAVVARELALHTDRKIVVIDERDPVAGNCHTGRDESTGVMLHRYGSHIFQADRDDVWRYVNSFVPFRPHFHRVMAHTVRGAFSLQMDGVIAETLDFAADFLKNYISKGKTLPRFTPALAEQIRQHRV